MELNVQDWKEYQVDKLFTVVLSKGDIKEDDMDSGTVRLVSSGESDNGIHILIVKVMEKLKSLMVM